MLKMLAPMITASPKQQTTITVQAAIAKSHSVIPSPELSSKSKQQTPQ